MAATDAAKPAIGTTGTCSTVAYELTGSSEKQAEAFVGQRVEISGRLKAADVGPAGPTGGPTAGAPPSGVDVTSRDLKLRELEITTVRKTTGTCPAQWPLRFAISRHERWKGEIPMIRKVWGTTVHLLQHTAVAIGGIILIVFGLAMTFSLVFVVPGLFVLAVGVAVVVGAIFSHSVAGP
jgi:hypothetical protein